MRSQMERILFLIAFYLSLLDALKIETEHQAEFNLNLSAQMNTDVF